MIKAIIFDCFGVFYTDPVFAYIRDPQSPQDKATALHELDKQAAVGSLTKSDFIVQAASLLSITSEEAENRFFQGYDLNEALIDYSQTLRNSYKVSLLSNIGGDMMDGFFSSTNQAELFDNVILSGDVKLAKPDKAIFELACTRLGVQLSEAVMVDDMQSTIDAVRSFGMQGVCYKNTKQIKDDLAQLLAEAQ